VTIRLKILKTWKRRDMERVTKFTGIWEKSWKGERKVICGEYSVFWTVSCCEKTTHCSIADCCKH